MTKGNNIFIILQNRQKHVPIGRAERETVMRAAREAYAAGTEELKPFKTERYESFAPEHQTPRISERHESYAPEQYKSCAPEHKILYMPERKTPHISERRIPRAPERRHARGGGGRVKRPAVGNRAGRAPRAGAEIALTLTDDEGIRGANREFRGIDRATDVLSFPLTDFAEAGSATGARFCDPQNGRAQLGDVVISAERALAQAREYGHGYGRELGFLAAHGVLHLLGYDHEGGGEEEMKMRRLSERALARAGLSESI